MATGQGNTTISFGVDPGHNEANSIVTGVTNISTTSKVEAYVMASDTTPTHTANDHRYFSTLAGISCGDVVAGVGFTVYVNSVHKLTGDFNVRYVWSD